LLKKVNGRCAEKLGASAALNLPSCREHAEGEDFSIGKGMWPK